jgi:sugar lactone lactonase YvrE
MITPDGIIHAFAGNGQAGSSGNGHGALSAELMYPWGIAVDGNGNVFISDEYFVRAVTPDGNIQVVAGNPAAGFNGDGGPAVAAAMEQPLSVAVDSSGNVYVVEQSNERVRILTPAAN